MGISCGKIVKVHIACTAADHTEILHIVFCQGEIVSQRGTFIQHLCGDLLGTVFYRTAADGTAETAAFADQHTGTGTPGGSAGGGDHRDQNQRLSTIQMCFHSFKHFPHFVILRCRFVSLREIRWASQ